MGVEIDLIIDKTLKRFKSSLSNVKHTFNQDINQMIESEKMKDGTRLTYEDLKVLNKIKKAIEKSSSISEKLKTSLDRIIERYRGRV